MLGEVYVGWDVCMSFTTTLILQLIIRKIYSLTEEVKISLLYSHSHVDIRPGYKNGFHIEGRSDVSIRSIFSITKPHTIFTMYRPAMICIIFPEIKLKNKKM